MGHEIFVFRSNVPKFSTGINQRVFYKAVEKCKFLILVRKTNAENTGTSTPCQIPISVTSAVKNESSRLPREVPPAGPGPRGSGPSRVEPRGKIRQIRHPRV